ncbi:MAG: type IX secretion system sortase PorU, partial [Prevotella sp.]|nr:type IX secretion system sortase PorU [Prevotella sp.]
QDLHADKDIQMVIVIPTTQKLREQAERIKTLHERNDGMTVKIVPADELYNEFSSGTPDANAYRRYMKMLYDRAENEEQMPRYLLLFGDCAWDNRMNSGAWKGYNPDDFLLCMESENSFSKTDCYVDDGFFCCLDDGEGGSPERTDRQDIAVGRFPVRTVDEAKILVDKTIAYIENKNAGAWQNTVMFMGDDGNGNQHMKDADLAANLVATLNPALHVKKVMWDAYTRQTSSTGNSYPDVTNIIKQQQQAGALVMDYCGHGSETSISHERVLLLNDFKEFVNDSYPLWITASCDIAPFDGQTDNIGEYALLNSKGGAVAFFGTTRTVYADRNRAINLSYLRALFTTQEGKYVSIGEAQRIAKNNLLSSNITINGVKVTNPDGVDLTINKLQYSLLGDPALVLKIPTQQAVVDSINGVAVNGTGTVSIKAGQTVRVNGHIEKDKQLDASFNGVITAVVRDSEEMIVCKLNDTTTDGADEAFVYNDRTKILFNGQDSVQAGRFTFSFAVPKDINYSDEAGQINLYAVDNSKTLMANGVNERMIIGGSDISRNDSIGPSVYCYLNSPQFINGGTVNTTPYFVAVISDEDGLNTTGNGIGHDLELIIDGEMAKTYNLNDNFVYDFGSYTSGSTYYNIPALEPGPHKLKFRAWDILNNSSTTELAFTVVKGLEPDFFSVGLSDNPAKGSTTFIINHDRTGSDMDVEIEVFDVSGRQLWKHKENAVPTSGAYTVSWNLSLDNGQRLQTGVYLYRVHISSDGSKKVSKSKKLIVVGG